MEDAEASVTHPDLGPTDQLPLPTDLAGHTPTAPAAPTKLDEVDHLKYQLLGSDATNAELKIAMYERELQHAQIDRENTRYKVAQFVRELEAKYGTNLAQYMVSADGYLLPRDLGQRQALKRS